VSARILVTGKNGQIGAELETLLPRLGDTTALDRQHLDLAKPEQIRAVIREFRPQLIVNAAAYTAVDQAESDPVAARAVNADAPAVIAEEARKIGAAIVHFSTDYVFDGMKTSPYEENDPPNPLSVYGKTKLAGEEAIRHSGVPHFIFRTAWVYGTRGRNFLVTVLRLASQREELRIVCDQTGAPTWCREIARATVAILERFATGSARPLSLSDCTGTYHMTAGGATSWHGFAQAILGEVAQVSPAAPWLKSATGGKPILARRVLPIPTVEYPTPARRPAYSVLSNSRLIQTFGIELPEWRVQLHSAISS
jgi:dTDP-4-dehydrorhamnose reductase